MGNMTQVPQISEYPMCSIRNEDVVRLDIVVAVIRLVEALYIAEKILEDWSEVRVHVSRLGELWVVSDLLGEILQIATLQHRSDEMPFLFLSFRCSSLEVRLNREEAVQRSTGVVIVCEFGSRSIVLVPAET